MANSRGWRHGWPIALLMLACSQADPGPPEPIRAGRDALVVYAVNHPLAYFAGRIGAGEVEVTFPAPPDVDPSDWAPTPAEIVAFQGADLILRNGAGYARWIQRASLPRSRLVDTSASFSDRLIELRAGVSHAHGPTGEHSHLGTAGTTWLDPRLAIEQARSIAQAFAGLRPQREHVFLERFGALEAELLQLDRRLAAATSRIGDAPVLFSHPVYQYFERRYGLNGRAVAWEPNELPSPAMWRELESILSSHPARLMLWEAQPLAETARRLAALEVDTLVYSLCANRPAAGDWLTAMRANASRLAAAADR